MRNIRFTHAADGAAMRVGSFGRRSRRNGETAEEGAAVPQAHIKYISGLLLFGLNGVVSSRLAMPSMGIVFYRTLLGSLFLLLLLLLKREPLRPDAPPRQTAAAALSCVSMGLSWIFLYEAYQRIGVGLSSVVHYCGQ